MFRSATGFILAACCQRHVELSRPACTAVCTIHVAHPSSDGSQQLACAAQSMLGGISMNADDISSKVSSAPAFPCCATTAVVRRSLCSRRPRPFLNQNGSHRRFSTVSQPPAQQIGESQALSGILKTDSGAATLQVNVAPRPVCSPQLRFKARTSLVRCACGCQQFVARSLPAVCPQFVASHCRLSHTTLGAVAGWDGAAERGEHGGGGGGGHPEERIVSRAGQRHDLQTAHPPTRPTRAACLRCHPTHTNLLSAVRFAQVSFSLPFVVRTTATLLLCLTASVAVSQVKGLVVAYISDSVMGAKIPDLSGDRAVKRSLADKLTNPLSLTKLSNPLLLTN